MHFEQAASAWIVLIEEHTIDLLANHEGFGSGGTSCGSQRSEQIVALGGAKQYVHFFQHLSKFCMYLVIPVLCFNQCHSFREETRAYFDDGIVLGIACLYERLQDTPLVSDVEGYNRKHACFTAHFANFVRKLAEMLLYLFRKRKQID